MNIRTWLKKQRIGVLYGGRSSERDISLKTGTAVLRALTDAGYAAVGIDSGPDLPLRLRKEKVSYAFISLHGPWGEDGTVQGLLEIMGIPYAGCGVLSSALSMNKVYSKRILDSCGLPTAPWEALERGAATRGSKLLKKLPVVVKPATQGSAIGVSVIRRKQDIAPALKKAFSLGSQVIAEKYVKGTEITVGILGRTALPVIEIVPDNDFYDFESKYQPGKSRHLIPARLPSAVLRRVQELAVKTFDALNCKAMARIDMIVDRNNNPWILEANTIPGMTETSLYPDAARAAGLGFAELIEKVIKHSLKP